MELKCLIRLFQNTHIHLKPTIWQFCFKIYPEQSFPDNNITDKQKIGFQTPSLLMHVNTLLILEKIYVIRIFYKQLNVFLQFFSIFTYSSDICIFDVTHFRLSSGLILRQWVSLKNYD